MGFTHANGTSTLQLVRTDNGLERSNHQVIAQDHSCWREHSGESEHKLRWRIEGWNRARTGFQQFHSRRSQLVKVPVSRCAGVKGGTKFQNVSIEVSSESKSLLRSSNISLPIHPHKRPSCRKQQHPSNHKARPSPNIRIHISPVRHLNQRARKWRPRQARKAHNRKRHPHPHTRLLQILLLTAFADNRRPQRLNNCGAGAVNRGKRVQPADSVDPDPRVHHDAAEEGKRDEHVERADLIRVVRREQAEDEAHGDGDKQQVDGGLVRHAEDIAAVGANVEKRKVQAPEVEEHGRAIECVRQVAEGGPVHDFAAFAGWETCAEERDGDDVEGCYNEADDADCPGETEARETLLEDDGHDDASCAGS